MANPQPDKYTKISNELLDALIRYRIPGEQMQVFLFIMRKTYGYNKKQDAIALSQFVESTGMKKPSVVRALKALLAKKLIAVNKKANEPAHVYEIIKDYEEWEPLAKKITLTKKLTIVSKKANPSLAKKSTTKDNTTKEKKERADFYPDWLDMDLWKEFLKHRKHISKNKKSLSERAEKINITELKKFIDEGYTQGQIINLAIAREWKGFYRPQEPPTQKPVQQDFTTYKERRKKEDQELIRMIQEAERNA
jgi:phage replication O-like protein O